MTTSTPLSRRRRRGFTLIEIMIVVVILGLLAGLVGPRILRNLDRAKNKTANAQANILKGCIKDYYMDMDRFPDKWEDMLQKPSDSKWDGPYLDPPKVPVDPWGSPYKIECKKDDRSIKVWSCGPDGQDSNGSGDDCSGDTSPQK